MYKIFKCWILEEFTDFPYLILYLVKYKEEIPIFYTWIWLPFEARYLFFTLNKIFKFIKLH